MITLKDVATHAGVSVATVSCCLSGAKNVRSSTKSKVMAAIEELGYIPNFAARNLKAAERAEIGVVLTDIDDWYHTEILKGITACVQRAEYDISIAFSNNLPHLECSEIDRFIGRNLSGLILITCQPNNTDFFQNRLAEHNIPAVFVEREPLGIDHNFISFDNYHMVHHLTEQLLGMDYRRIALVRGPEFLSSESDCLRGYTAACRSQELALEKDLIHSTNMSKEDAFRVAIELFHTVRPQAVIATSTGIAKGVLEAAELLSIPVPEEMPILALGEECWNNSNKLPGVVHTARAAFSMGVAATELLLKNIRSPRLFEKERIILQDSMIAQPIPVRPCSRLAVPETIPKRETLRILAMDLPTTNALRLLADNFTQASGIEVEFTTLSQDALLKAIISDNDLGGGKYDVYMYDLPWTDYLVQNSLIDDITDLLADGEVDIASLLPENLEGCMFGGNYYGIPIIGGAQILFYRKDIFEDVSLCKAFEQQYKVSLRPPKTWTEFNGIAEFFTRTRHGESPVAFGTSLAAINNQELAPELLIRIWASGGALFDHNCKVRINSPACAKAMRTTLQTLDYVQRDPLQTSIRQTVADFCSGKTAMLITYSEYAAQISSSVHSQIIGRVGYSLIPGRTPVSVGWNLGMSLHAQNAAHVQAFFRWVCRKDISYYLTIIDGQSAAVHPYRNNELLKLYPWMNQTLDSFQHCRRRTGPHRPHSLIIPQSKLEDILCAAFHRIYREQADIGEALENAQVDMKYLFRSYGY